MWSVSAKQFRLDRDGQACALVDVNAVFSVQVEQNNTRVSILAFNQWFDTILGLK